jgi:nuclease S1
VQFRRLIFKVVRLFAVPIFLCGGTMMFAAPSVWAFGCEGHEIIAMIAETRLSPHAKAMVLQLLKDNPIDPALSRYCKQPDLDTMAYSSTWADDYKSAHAETGPWHYIDIPISVSKGGGDLAEFCPPSEGCVTQALKDQIALLRSPGTDSQKRADALRFVIHFVGDLHQPLHTSNNNDLGGNCIPVTYFGEPPILTNPQYENYAPNLHGVWDYEIYQKEFKDKTVQQAAAEFEHTFASQEAKWMRGPVDVDAWAWESFRIAKAIVYGKLPVPVSAEKPVGNHSCAEDDHISTRMLKLNEKLDQPYQDAALPVFQQQLAKAGARLALVLNRIWP